MAKVVLICGDTGTGKSRSIKNLNPKETFIINVLGKDLPFPGSELAYNKENKNLGVVSKYSDIVNYLNAISEKNPAIKNVVIDDIGFVMLQEFFDRSSETGLIE